MIGNNSDKMMRFDELVRGAVEVIERDVLLTRIETGLPLRVKFGMDPTAPDIHLGHTVVLNKLRQFQEAGHHILFLVGDFTALIGDPTGKSVTRKVLSREEIQINAETYARQAYKILDPERTEIRFNSSWCDQLSGADLLRLSSMYTVARILERDDFSHRYKNNQAIAIHELLYPLLQGYDSVVLKADLELGGTDQKFNLLVGRELQKQSQQPPQCVLTMPLLEGLDGIQKMSKSLNNYIALTDSPLDMFGKIMSISDDLMWRYYELLSFRSSLAVQALHDAVIQDGKNPRDVKAMLGEEIVARFYDAMTAKQVHQDFIERFRHHALPSAEMIRNVVLISEQAGLSIRYVLQRAALVTSTSEALRLIQQGAVRIDGERVSNQDYLVKKNSTHLYQVGKHRYARVTVE